MTTTAILISWITVCATYLRLRSAVKVQAFMVLDAVSPFQPLLAWYGLASSVVLGIIPRAGLTHCSDFSRVRKLYTLRSAMGAV